MIIRSSRRLNLVRGFTLIELMVALAIGLLMAFGLVRVFASSSDSYRSLAQASQQIENGRYAIQALSDDLKHAGYYGEYSFPPAPTAVVLPSPCETANTATMKAGLPFHIQGYDNVAASPIACLDDANVLAGTDVLVIRRANTVTTALGALVPNEVYMQANADSTNATNPVIALGTAANFTLTQKDAVTLSEIRKYRVIVYFVSPCSEPVGGTLCNASADGGRPIPTLKRLSLAFDGAALTMRTEAVAEGIENFQVDYGVDTDGDGLPDGAFLAAPATVPAWGDVMSAQIHVLARTPEAMPGNVDTKTYNLGTAGALTPGGNFRRHLFTAQVRLVNPAGRREVP